MGASSSLNNPIPAPDDLHSGDIKTQPWTVEAGTYVRGEVIAIDNANNTLQKMADAANAFAVMPENITLTADTLMAVYVGGDFNEDAITLNGMALAAVKTSLRKVGMFLRKWGVAS